MPKRLIFILVLSISFVTFSRAEADEPASPQHASTSSAAGSSQKTAALLEHADGEDLATAMGHFARSRSLLIAAVREFDNGYRLVDPSTLMDVKTWRDDVIDRAQDLERLLDPQPRASRKGVKFNADTRLLGEARK